MLLLGDRNFPSWKLWAHCADSGAHLLWRVKASRLLPRVGTFTDGMTNGRGFIALAAIIIGRWRPLGALFGCLLFGAVAALELRAHAWGLPVSSYVIQMLPYVAALALLAGIGRSARMPAAIGIPFRRQ